MGSSRSSRDGAVLTPEPPEVVRAAGGLVVRWTGAGPWQVAVVHRPHRLDWTFPKGKVEPGETLEDCALREVREETGLTCRLGPFVGHTEYRDRKDRPKVVAYWLMEPEGVGSLPPVAGRSPGDGEVDELRWEDVGGAASLLSYERDRELLIALVALEAPGTPGT